MERYEIWCNCGTPPDSDNGEWVKWDDVKHLVQPPALGGDPEVLANALPQCRDYSDEDDDWFRGQGKGFNECLGEVTPLVTRLQAEVERQKGREMGIKEEVFDIVCKERDTLRDVLALLAPDLKVMAILYKQKGEHERANALAKICESVGVL